MHCLEGHWSALRQPFDVLREHVDLEVDGRSGVSEPSVVTASVCGTSAISTVPAPRAAIVSETPSTASEPFSAQ